MRVTIIKDDSSVYVGGVCHTVDVSDLPADFHALQWDGVRGEIEYRSAQCDHCATRSKKPNEFLADFSPYQKYVDAWYVVDAAARVAVEKARAEAAARAAERMQADAAGQQD